MAMTTDSARPKKKRGMALTLTKSLSMSSNSTRLLPYLVLGGQESVSDFTTLEMLGVTHVLNVSGECKQWFEDRLSYLRLPIEDETSADAASHFPAAHRFLSDVRDRNGRGENTAAMVHCKTGMSRSSTMVLAHMMLTDNMLQYIATFNNREGMLDDGATLPHRINPHMTLRDALAYIRERRPRASPNAGFMLQLIELEATLHGGATTIDLEKYKRDRFGDVRAFCYGDIDPIAGYTGSNSSSSLNDDALLLGVAPGGDCAVSGGGGGGGEEDSSTPTYFPTQAHPPTARGGGGGGGRGFAADSDEEHHHDLPPPPSTSRNGGGSHSFLEPEVAVEGAATTHVEAAHPTFTVPFRAPKHTARAAHSRGFDFEAEDDSAMTPAIPAPGFATPPDASPPLTGEAYYNAPVVPTLPKSRKPKTTAEKYTFDEPDDDDLIVPLGISPAAAAFGNLPPTTTGTGSSATTTVPPPFSHVHMHSSTGERAATEPLPPVTRVRGTSTAAREAQEAPGSAGAVLGHSLAAACGINDHGVDVTASAPNSTTSSSSSTQSGGDRDVLNVSGLVRRRSAVGDLPQVAPPARQMAGWRHTVVPTSPNVQPGSASSPVTHMHAHGSAGTEQDGEASAPTTTGGFAFRKSRRSSATAAAFPESGAHASTTAAIVAAARADVDDSGGDSMSLLAPVFSTGCGDPMLEPLRSFSSRSTTESNSNSADHFLPTARTPGEGRTSIQRALPMLSTTPIVHGGGGGGGGTPTPPFSERARSESGLDMTSSSLAVTGLGMYPTQQQQQGASGSGGSPSSSTLVRSPSVSGSSILTRAGKTLSAGSPIMPASGSFGAATGPGGQLGGGTTSSSGKGASASFSADPPPTLAPMVGQVSGMSPRGHPTYGTAASGSSGSGTPTLAVASVAGGSSGLFVGGQSLHVARRKP